MDKMSKEEREYLEAIREYTKDKDRRAKRLEIKKQEKEKEWA